MISCAASDAMYVMMQGICGQFVTLALYVPVAPVCMCFINSLCAETINCKNRMSLVNSFMQCYSFKTLKL